MMTECCCISCNFGNDVLSELEVLRFQSYFEVFRLESVWSWGRARCQVANRPGNLVACDFSHGRRAVPQILR